MPDRRPIPAPGSPDPLPAWLSPAGPDCVVTVRVIPRAGRTGLAGERRGSLLVRLTAPPVEGAANEALVAALAGWLEVPRRALSIVSGERSRDKRVRVTGLAARDAAIRLHRASP
jgi:uncharacterized protein (TIGR00251 family)